jgi:DNA-binding response OmpR family regulator
MHTLLSTLDRRAPSPQAGRASKRILIIGADESTGAMLASHLEAPRFQVDTAADEAEALASIRLNPPALIVLDATTPGQYRWDMPSWRRSAGVQESTPIVALSTRAALREVVARDGVWVCLVKPVQPAVLVGAIERITNYNYSYAR